MTIFRIRFELQGGHVHCSLFAAKAPGHTFAKCGDFVVRKGDEFRDLVHQFDDCEFIGKETSVGLVECCAL